MVEKIAIAEVLPELREEQYAQVREWDAARMALAGSYEAADGEYLRKIRDVLKEAGHGLWTRYLEARGIPEPTAYERIRRAEGRYVRAPHDKPMAAIGLHNPTPAQLPPPTYEPVAAWPTEYIGPDTPPPSKTFADYRAETPEAQAEPFDKFVLRLHRFVFVEESAILAWLQTSDWDEQETTLEMLADIREQVQRAEALIQDRVHAGPRAIK